MGDLGENRKRNKVMLKGNFRKNGFELWRHNFTAYSKSSGDQKTFFIEFYMLNPAVSPDEISFENNQTVAKKEGKPSFLMVKAGYWGPNGKQFHAFLPISKMQYNKHKLNIRADNFLLTETELFGAIEVLPTEMKLHPEYLTDSGVMKWKIKMDKKIAFLPKKLKIVPPSFWYVQGAKTMYGGAIILDGEEYAVVNQKSYGHADKFWGRDFPDPFVWLSSCNLISIISGSYLPSSCFDLSGTFYDEKHNSFNVFFCQQNQSYSFSSKNSKIKCIYSENDEFCHWQITAENKKNLLDVDIFSRKRDMVPMKYMNSRGTITFEKFLSGGNGSGEIRLYKKVNRTLEIMEHARVENCACEFASNSQR